VRDVISVIQQQLQLENLPKRELSPISFLRCTESKIFDSDFAPAHFEVLDSVIETWGCLHFRSVPQEHRLINKDWPRSTHNYNEENQTRPLHSTHSVCHKRILFTHGFINITLSNAHLLSNA